MSIALRKLRAAWLKPLPLRDGHPKQTGLNILQHILRSPQQLFRNLPVRFILGHSYEIERNFEIREDQFARNPLADTGSVALRHFQVAFAASRFFWRSAVVE